MILLLRYADIQRTAQFEIFNMPMTYLRLCELPSNYLLIQGTDDTNKNNFDAKAANFENDEDNEDDELEGVDMDDFLEKLDEDLETAHSMVKKAALVDPTVASADDGSVAGDGEEEILATRTYDLNITYDNYYRTPRLWLTGYDEVTANSLLNHYLNRCYDMNMYWLIYIYTYVTEHSNKATLRFHILSTLIKDISAPKRISACEFFT